MKKTDFLKLVAAGLLALPAAGCGDDGNGGEDASGDGTANDGTDDTTNGVAADPSLVGEGAYRVTVLELVSSHPERCPGGSCTDLGVIGVTLGTLIDTDTNCGILSIVANAHSFDDETNGFSLDAAGAIPGSDEVYNYCENEGTSGVPDPDPRTYSFVDSVEPARNVPTIFTAVNLGNGSVPTPNAFFDTQESFDIVFPAITPASAGATDPADIEYINIPLTDVQFGGLIHGEIGSRQIVSGYLEGALIEADVAGVEVALDPDAEPSTIPELLASQRQTYPFGCCDEGYDSGNGRPEQCTASDTLCTGWALYANLEAEEVGFAGASEE